jgi:hypothetical protein
MISRQAKTGKKAFTPGPWELVIEDGIDVRECRIYGGVFPGAKRAVVEIADVWAVDSRDPQATREANAALIAAAPDLYEALSDLLDFCDVVSSNESAWEQSVNRARAALSKVSP